jgi:predicted XRE-type DNA-binding protein
LIAAASFSKRVIRTSTPSWADQWLPVLNSELVAAVSKAIARLSLTHAEVARRACLPRSAVTGILSGSLRRVTIDRVLRLVEAVGLTTEVRVERAA